MFMDVIYLGVRRPFLGQNLPQIRNFHKVGGDIRLVGFDVLNEITRDLLKRVLKFRILKG